jgi:hypothetical protein
MSAASDSLDAQKVAAYLVTRRSNHGTNAPRSFEPPKPQFWQGIATIAEK